MKDLKDLSVEDFEYIIMIKKAQANGEAMQRLDVTGWEDLETHIVIEFAYATPQHYRVKPTPFEAFVNVYDGYNLIYDTEDEAEKAAGTDVTRTAVRMVEADPQ